MIVDHALLQKIEDAIAAERSAFAEGMAACSPETGACWLPIAGGRAIFTGMGFFSNRAMAMGMHGPVSGGDMDGVETFYATRHVPSEIEIASMVDRSLLRLLAQRGYQLVRFRNIYAQTLPPDPVAGSRQDESALGVEVHRVDASTAPAWSSILLDGFGYTQEADRQRVVTWNHMVRSLSHVTPLITLFNGKPAGAASVMVVGTVAVLGGAATLPTCWRRGVQRVLIEARLNVAAQAGCTLAIVTADPGSSSGRNAERSSFQLMCNHVSMRASERGLDS